MTASADRHPQPAAAIGDASFLDAVGEIAGCLAILAVVRDAAGEIADFRYEYVNAGFAELVATEREQLQGYRVSEVFPGFLEDPRFAVYCQVAQSGGVDRADVRRGADGWAGATLAGRVEHTVICGVGDRVIVAAEDVTEARAAERELKLRSQLLDRAHDAVIVREPSESRISFWNREAELIYGYSAAEAIGQVTHDLLATVFPDSRGSVEEALSSEGQWSGVLLHTTKGGAVIEVSSRQALLRDSERTAPTAVIELNSDITAERGAERRITVLNESLSRRAAELDEANRELEAFAYSIAHDLRAPLRAIAGFTGMLEQGGHIAPDDQSGGALIGRVTAAARRMGELIEALLSLAHTSRRELNISRVDLTGLARQVADELRAGDPDRNVEFLIEDGLEADGDPQLVRSLLLSLLENAWKYSSLRPQARIEVVRGEAGAFAVRDNGAGFDMAYAAQLFRPFGRLHREDEFPGTGVGLATAHRIVRRHGGTLTGEGGVGEGATFSFTLSSADRSRS